MSDPRSSDGFSLVEVLSAMLIAALALVTLFRGLGSSEQAALYLEAQLGARLLAESIVEDERQSDRTASGTRSGDSGMYRWQLTIEPVSLAALRDLPSAYRMYRISAEVRWLPRGHLAVETLKIAR